MTSRPLIAIVTCHALRERALAQRETWAKNVQGADVRFFVGGGEAQLPDEVVLPVADDYHSLPAKTQAMFRWALEHEYTHVFKSDDDSYIQVERLLASGYEKADYMGRVRGPSGPYPAVYCSGFAYWLSAKAAKIIAETTLNGDTAEDRVVGNALLDAGIHPVHDARYAVVTSNRNMRSAREGPRQGNDIIAACEFQPDHMHGIHHEWLHVKTQEQPKRLPQGSLSKVAVLIKTFLRDILLVRCVVGIQHNLPDVQMIIVDDGYESRQKIDLYSRLREYGHQCLWLPFDSGFGAKANEGIKYLQRPYLLIGSDDFDFADESVRAGIEKLVTVLDNDPSIGIASGRVNGNPYEAMLELGPDWAKETPGCYETKNVKGVDYCPTDLTVNFSLIRSSLLGPHALHWDGGEAKIGQGEHGSFFVDAKRLGIGVAYVPGVNINELEQDRGTIDPLYPQMRARARMPGRACLKARGINRWQLQSGEWEEC